MAARYGAETPVLETDHRERVSLRVLPTRRDVAGRPMRWDREVELDLAYRRRWVPGPPGLGGTPLGSRRLTTDYPNLLTSVPLHGEWGTG
jgi:hypothetical protein